MTRLERLQMIIEERTEAMETARAKLFLLQNGHLSRRDEWRVEEAEEELARAEQALEWWAVDYEEEYQELVAEKEREKAA